MTSLIYNECKAEKKRRIYYENREKGICPQCRQRKAKKGDARCGICVEKRHLMKIKYRKLCKGHGCKKYIEQGGRVYCDDCDTQQNKWSRESQQRKMNRSRRTISDEN